MQEVYDITETALREFLVKHCIGNRFIPAGSYLAVDMSFNPDNCRPIRFCVFDVSDNPNVPIDNVEQLYLDDCFSYEFCSRSYANDYEVWHVISDPVIPDVANTYYQVRGYVAEDEPTETYQSDYCIDGSFNSCRLATEFAYTIFNSPCFYVTVHSYVGDEFEESKILELKSDRRLYSRFAGRVRREVA